MNINYIEYGIGVKDEIGMTGMEESTLISFNVGNTQYFIEAFKDGFTEISRAVYYDGGDCENGPSLSVGQEEIFSGYRRLPLYRLIVNFCKDTSTNPIAL